ncbi:MAG: hypothetical protein EOP88_20075 [Verrucomicrobiaceae bacterium]|nr:MAG: hypothetical protein EOP88_20075 [Verrucomicrobiaceae bacterium]
MTTRWYRSRLFWFGLAGLVMLVGAGVSFEGKVSAAGWSGRDRSFGVWVDPDSVSVSYLDLRHPTRAGSTGGRAGFQTFTTEVDSTPTFWVPAVRLDRDGATTQLHVGIWFILLLYSAVWFGSMVWWLRRKHRLIRQVLENSMLPQ